MSAVSKTWEKPRPDTPRGDQVEEPDEKLASLAIESLSISHLEPPNLQGRKLETLSPSPPPEEEAPTVMSPDDLIQTLLKSWESLQTETNEDPLIPPTTLYPDKNLPYPYLQFIENIKEKGSWQICGNWITNPHDPVQKIAVFQYPTVEECFLYWSLIRQHRLNLIDLTDAKDHELLEVTKENFQFYPPFDQGIYQFGSEPLTIRCSKKDGLLGYYETQKKGKTFETMVLHYPHWPDGDVIEIEELDTLVDFVLTAKEIGVHCRAGVGRTGTLTTAAFIKHLIQNNRIQKNELTPKWLSDFIFQLRRQRSKDWVLNERQYVLLYQYGRWLFEPRS